MKILTFLLHIIFFAAMLTGAWYGAWWLGGTLHPTANTPWAFVHLYSPAFAIFGGAIGAMAAYERT